MIGKELLRNSALVAALSLAGFGLAACGDDNVNEPAPVPETTTTPPATTAPDRTYDMDGVGDRMEEGVDDTGDAIEEGLDDTGDALEDMGDEMEETIEEPRN